MILHPSYKEAAYITSCKQSSIILLPDFGGRARSKSNLQQKMYSMEKSGARIKKSEFTPHYWTTTHACAAEFQAAQLPLIPRGKQSDSQKSFRSMEMRARTQQKQKQFSFSAPHIPGFALSGRPTRSASHANLQHSVPPRGSWCRDRSAGCGGLLSCCARVRNGDECDGDGCDLHVMIGKHMKG